MKNASTKSDWNESTTLAHLANAGCNDLIERCREYLTETAYKMVLQQLSLGVAGYDVAHIDAEGAKARCRSIVNERSHRAASTMHLLCVIDELSHHGDTFFFELKSRDGGDKAFDVVVVTDNGSFACSEPYFAQYGMPGRHIYAVFAAQFCNINPLLHFHPRYIRHISNPMDGCGRNPREIGGLSWPDKLNLTSRPAQVRVGYQAPAVTRSTSWSWAIDKVTRRATETVLGGEDMAAAALRPNLHGIRVAPERNRDRMNKAINVIRKSMTAAELESVAANAKKKTASKRKTNSFHDPTGSGLVITQQPLPVAKKAKRQRGFLERAQSNSRGKRI